MIRPRRKLHLVHRCAHERLASIVQLAELAHNRRAHIRVAGRGVWLGWLAIRPYEPLPLAFTRRLHPLADGFGRFPQSLVAEFFVFHARHFDVDVDAIQQRAGGCRSQRARLWYFVTVPAEQVQGFTGSEK